MQDAGEGSPQNKMNKTSISFHRAMIPRILMVGLFAAIIWHTESLNQAYECGFESHSQREDVNALNYKVTPFFIPADPSRFAIVYVTIDQQHFNRQDMRTLAAQLNQKFEKQARLRVALFDDDRIPQLMVKGGVQLSDFHKAQRGMYYLDRTKCKEYIEFSTRKGMPRNEIAIRTKCTP